MRDEERYVFWCQREDRPAIVLPIRRMGPLGAPLGAVGALESRVDAEGAGSGLRCSGCGLADVPIDGDELHGFLCRVRETAPDVEPSPSEISSTPARAARLAGLPNDAPTPNDAPPPIGAPAQVDASARAGAPDPSTDARLRLALEHLERRVQQLELRAGAVRSDGQRRVLGVLADLVIGSSSDGSETLRPAQICDRTGLPRGEVGRALEALRRAGFVEWTRASGAGDWRATAEGAEEVEFWRASWGSTGTRAR